MNQGNQFIVQLLGVNAEQFRQLFILPQGEFKSFFSQIVKTNNRFLELFLKVSDLMRLDIYL